MAVWMDFEVNDFTHCETTIFSVKKSLNMTNFREISSEERHLSRDEQYDGNMNVIVPVKERRAFLCVKRLDAEMTEANELFGQTQKHLNQTLVECSKLNDAIHANFKAFLITWLFFSDKLISTNKQVVSNVTLKRLLIFRLIITRLLLHLFREIAQNCAVHVI